MKLLRILVPALALVAALVAPSSVGAFHQFYACRDTNLHKVFANIVNPGGAPNANGVSASIDVSGSADPDSYFGTCAPQEGGTEAYVRLVTKTPDNETQNLTLGVVRCYGDPLPPLGDDGTECEQNGVSEAVPEYFIAFGGCGAYISTPRIVALPSIHPGYGSHSYKIQRSADGLTFEFLIDGVVRYSVALTHSSIACWIYDNKGASFAGDVLDDGSLVGASSAPTNMDLLKVRPSGGSFTQVTPTGCFTSANPTYHPFSCTWGAGYFDIWNTWS